jgi:predicted ferric reductase
MLTAGLLLAAVDKKLAWYVSRAGGLVAWAVVTASIIWGLALSTRLVSKRGAPAWLLDLHRYLGALSLVFTAIHIVSLPFDNYAHISTMELLVPFRSSPRSGYAPEPIAWGVVAFYLVVAIQLTSWIKKYLSRRVWHSIHLLSMPLFVVATVHGFKAGTERNNRLIIWGSIVGGIIFFFLLLFRIFSKIGDPPERVRSKTPDPASMLSDSVVNGRPARNSRIPESALLARSERAAAALVSSDPDTGIDSATH